MELQLERKKKKALSFFIFADNMVTYLGIYLFSN